ncbi:MvaI/BcnI family restriction endonuclease [Hymenobacter sp.]|uniref:MvaI/BcnI family restriction endonuclease n=1 Tax=Hymenobacter sp. TaxID=1898978 RepID=UPI00286A960E|nr:MvaI/BcnI family restriction endonuclease [Hymenobacter sp.]
MERADAVKLLNQLLNQDLVAVAQQHGVAIFVNEKKNKGWAGHTLERYLQLPLNSSRAPNFGSWELKSTSLVYGRDGNLRVKETVAITMLDPIEILQKEFEESHLYNKLRKTLLVARIHESQLDTRSILHSIAEFDLNDPALHRALKADTTAFAKWCAAVSSYRAGWVALSSPEPKARATAARRALSTPEKNWWRIC